MKDFMKDLKILITGGTSGLGLALVNELLSRGAQVATFARNQKGLMALKEGHPNLIAFTADVSKKEEIHRIAALAHAGLGHIDVLINNASSLGPTPLRPLLDSECEDFEDVLQANLLGPF